MINKRNLMVVVTCVLAAGMYAQAQDVQSQNAQPAVQSIVAVNTPAPSLGSTSAQPAEAKPMTQEEKDHLKDAKYARLSMWDWDTLHNPDARPSDNMFGEWGWIRPALERHNLGIFAIALDGFVYNLANPPMYGMPKARLDATPEQQYQGEKPTFNAQPNAWLTWVPKSAQGKNIKTQFVVGGLEQFTTENVFFINNSKFSDAHINFRIKKNLRIELGYMVDGWSTVGLYTGGNMAGSMLGVSAVLPTMVGQDLPPGMAPTLHIKYAFPHHFYSVSGVLRSLDPTNQSNGNAENRVGFQFHLPNAKAFLEQELGYRRQPGRGQTWAWERLALFYNASHYYDFRSTYNPVDGMYDNLVGYNFLNYGTNGANKASQTVHGFESYQRYPGLFDRNNFCFDNGIDWQITQPDGFSRKGVILGTTIQFAPPKENLFTQYYEFRAYYGGLFPHREHDLTTVMINDLRMSKAVIAAFQGACAVEAHVGVGTTVCAVPINTSGLGWSTASDNQVNVSLTHIARLRAGMMWTNGFEWTEHPTISPVTPNSAQVTTALVMFF
jgi:hypothetical protein